MAYSPKAILFKVALPRGGLWHGATERRLPTPLPPQARGPTPPEHLFSNPNWYDYSRCNPSHRLLSNAGAPHLRGIGK